MVTLRAAIDWFTTAFFVEKGGKIVDSFKIPHECDDDDGNEQDEDNDPDEGEATKWQKEDLMKLEEMCERWGVEFCVTPSDVWKGEGLIPISEGLEQMKAWSK